MKLLSLIAATTALAAVNEPCIGADGNPGVCVASASCSSSGGTAISGACPADAADVQCCSKPSCQGAGSRCSWASDCGGASSTGLCPGPSQMQCCDDAGDAWGGYGAPAVPAVGACQQVAVDGANTLLAAWPGRVREVFCTRDCACPGTSDHCCGKAIDFMCSDAGGVPTLSGSEIAEWVMKNPGPLNLKYVIWGQKIWSPTTDGAEKPWTQWRTMEDRGDVTQNHWDHVHVSFN
ncbi:hypothetical protein N3K66_002910 [Trichothecium roseum]|uniref:Uncharacterized protein n=1 Tax=Trichothecium roseum TaxID=47278 RepID=A0ACC0V4F6_9HYPO|nr:hypothetical protein N3K66_002910 [Trichothecium roseum]